MRKAQQNSDASSFDITGVDMTTLLDQSAAEDDSVLMNGTVSRPGMSRKRGSARTSQTFSIPQDPRNGMPDALSPHLSEDDDVEDDLPALPRLDMPPELEETRLPASPTSGGGGMEPPVQPPERRASSHKELNNPEDTALPQSEYMSQVQAANEAYAEEERLLASEWQREALGHLRQMDERRLGRFTARQALELVQLMQANTEAALPPPRKFVWGDYITCNCLVWVAILIVIVWIPMVVAATVARELKADETGILVSAHEGVPAATATFLSYGGFADLQTMPEGTLRRVHDCTFVHRGAFHRLRVASLVRTGSGDVTVTAQDHSSLRIRGSLSSGIGAVSFTRPFYGEEHVDLGKIGHATEPTGCTFTAMSSAPARGRPPR